MLVPQASSGWHPPGVTAYGWDLVADQVLHVSSAYVSSPCTWIVDRRSPEFCDFIGYVRGGFLIKRGDWMIITP